ncbi:hypothetical protein P389DRAFT_14201 [Cystobasidium minutum MCA 4210]|uniref:uncharacterized protein n=1 Tax=Cystobasidium minutum MCA 4210 TaxID=1397322 RepID=UPI0034CF1771|eukprot:jgi/Rhomi1/14201/CE14200_161
MAKLVEATYARIYSILKRTWVGDVSQTREEYTADGATKHQLKEHGRDKPIPAPKGHTFRKSSAPIDWKTFYGLFGEDLFDYLTTAYIMPVLESGIYSVVHHRRHDVEGVDSIRAWEDRVLVEVPNGGPGDSSATALTTVRTVTSSTRTSRVPSDGRGRHTSSICRCSTPCITIVPARRGKSQPGAEVVAVSASILYGRDTAGLPFRSSYWRPSEACCTNWHFRRTKQGLGPQQVLSITKLSMEPVFDLQYCRFLRLLGQCATSKSFTAGRPLSQYVLLDSQNERI